MKDLILILIITLPTTISCFSQTEEEVDDTIIGQYKLLETEFNKDLPDCGFILVGFMNTYQHIESGTIYRFFHLCPEQYEDNFFEIDSFYKIKTIREPVTNLRYNGLLYSFKDGIESVYVVQYVFNISNQSIDGNE